MTAPTSAALALFRSTLPVRRVASANKQSDFSAVLKATKTPTLTPAQLSRQTQIYHSTMMSAAAAPSAPAPLVAGGPVPMKRSDILKNAESLMGIPYVWGGTVNAGLDCSAFVSKVWGVSRHTTDNLASVSHAVSKDDLQAGDALNLTTANDPEGSGHVRLFDRWADAAHTRMYVYEETPPKSIHHVINWDPKYQPMRRTNVIDALAASVRLVSAGDGRRGALQRAAGPQDQDGHARHLPRVQGADAGRDRRDAATRRRVALR